MGPSSSSSPGPVNSGEGDPSSSKRMREERDHWRACSHELETLLGQLMGDLKALVKQEKETQEQLRAKDQALHKLTLQFLAGG